MASGRVQHSPWFFIFADFSSLTFPSFTPFAPPKTIFFFGVALLKEPPT